MLRAMSRTSAQLPAVASIPPPPAFRTLTVSATPSGFTVMPRGGADGLWIEAIAWSIAFVVLGLLFWRGGPVLRVIAAISLVGVGIRALLRIVFAIVGGRLRALRVQIGVPRPVLAGTIETVAFDQIANLEIGVRLGQRGLIASTFAGRQHWLVEIAAANADDYQDLLEWLELVRAHAQQPARAPGRD